MKDESILRHQKEELLEDNRMLLAKVEYWKDRSSELQKQLISLRKGVEVWKKRLRSKAHLLCYTHDMILDQLEMIENDRR